LWCGPGQRIASQIYSHGFGFKVEYIFIENIIISIILDYNPSIEIRLGD
jgi:hypothetical protein